MAVKKLNGHVFSKVCAAVAESLALYPRKCQHIAEAIETTQEVNHYIRERCGEKITAFADGLNEIMRDCAIYQSRINHLFDRLGRVERMIAACRRGLTSDRISKCVEEFLAWHDMDRDFSAEFGKAQRRWLSHETKILNAVEGKP